MMTSFSTKIMTNKKFSLEIIKFCIQYKKKIKFSKNKFFRGMFRYGLCHMSHLSKLFLKSNLHSIQKENHYFEKKILRECFVVSYVICRICQISYLSIDLNLNCPIHKTVANVISRICQMSKIL